MVCNQTFTVERPRSDCLCPRGIYSGAET